MSACRHIQHAGRLQRGVVRKRREVDQHLQADAVQNIRQFEIFVAGFVVDHTDIRAVFARVQVHAVDHTADRNGSAFRRNAQGREICTVLQCKFKVFRTEPADAHFLRHMENQFDRRLRHTAEAVFFSVGKCIEPAHILVGILPDARPYTGFQYICGKRGDIPRFVADDLFKKIVHQTAVFKRV